MSETPSVATPAPLESKIRFSGFRSRYRICLKHVAVASGFPWWGSIIFHHVKNLSAPCQKWDLSKKRNHSLYTFPVHSPSLTDVQYTYVTHHVCLCILPGLPPQSAPIISPPQVPQDTTLSNNHSKKTYPIPSLRAMAHTLRCIFPIFPSHGTGSQSIFAEQTATTKKKHDRRAPGVQMFQTPGLSAAGWVSHLFERAERNHQ